jgi:hypothetical protein
MIEALLTLEPGQHVAIAGSSISVNEWARLMEYPSPMTLEVHPNWWYGADCTECKRRLFQCKHYPIQQKTALEWTAFLEQEAKRKPVDNSVESANNFAEKTLETALYTRARRTLVELAEEDKPKVLALFDAGQGGINSLAKDFNVQPQYMAAFLKANNRELIPKGGIRKTRKEMEPGEISTAVADFNAERMGMVALAQKYNVQIQYMKDTLVAHGCDVRRKGRRPKAAGEQAIAA